MTSTAPAQTKQTRYSLLTLELPGRDPAPLAVLLEDPQAGRLYLRFRRDLDALADDPEQLEYLRLLPADLEAKARDLGVKAFFGWMEDTLSGALRATDRMPADLMGTLERTLDRLYRRHVPATVLEFKTHLPRYTLRAAAGRFLDNDEVEPEGWEEAPENLVLNDKLFVAHIEGTSMEPLIPNHSLCVFRSGVVAGSRQGRLVLVQSLDPAGDAFAIKRYSSEKTVAGDGVWRHTGVRLESLNPDGPTWNLDPEEEKYRIMAEFVRVLD
ncbi:MAG: S24 family peptidase [Acidobacteriota bacterium]|nr:S24 family peptidase [Acidobacteriota bacterium]